jgi:hypothetical protein
MHQPSIRTSPLRNLPEILPLRRRKPRVRATRSRFTLDHHRRPPILQRDQVGAAEATRGTDHDPVVGLEAVAELAFALDATIRHPDAFDWLPVLLGSTSDN